MADGTQIEWTEATWNPITGCSLASPGCTNCYAMKLAGTRLAKHPSRAGLTQDSKAGPVWTGEVRFNEQWLDQPLRWTKPRMIFVCAHGDLFHENVPDEWIDRVVAIMALCPQHTFQVLTKRSARMREYLAAPFDLTPVIQAAANITQQPQRFAEFPSWPLPNVWLGVSVEDQQRADERVPDLLATPASIRWISAEPLLGPVDLTFIDYDEGAVVIDALAGRHGMMVPLSGKNAKLDWVVVGGESGKGARPMHPDWARSLCDQCAAAEVPFFFKQWGEWGPDTGPGPGRDKQGIMRDRVMEGAGPCRVLVDRTWQEFDSGYEPPIELCSGHGEFVYRLGKKQNGRLLDDVQHDGMPQAPR